MAGSFRRSALNFISKALAYGNGARLLFGNRLLTIYGVSLKGAVGVTWARLALTTAKAGGAMRRRLRLRLWRRVAMRGAARAMRMAKRVLARRARAA